MTYTTAARISFGKPGGLSFSDKIFRLALDLKFTLSVILKSNKGGLVYDHRRSQ